MVKNGMEREVSDGFSLIRIRLEIVPLFFNSHPSDFILEIPERAAVGDGGKKLITPGTGACVDEVPHDVEVADIEGGGEPIETVLVKPVVDLLLLVARHHHIVYLHDITGLLIQEVLGVPIVQFKGFQNIVQFHFHVLLPRFISCLLGPVCGSAHLFTHFGLTFPDHYQRRWADAFRLHFFLALLGTVNNNTLCLESPRKNGRKLSNIAISDVFDSYIFS